MTPPVARDRVTKPATYEDLLEVHPHLVAEILFGTLVTHPRPAPRHGGATLALGAILAPPWQFGRDGPGGWIFVDEPELHLGPHVVVPDLAGWRRERLSAPIDKAYFTLAPDWVCEALSPSTERWDKGEKRRIYAHYGVPYLWHIDARVHSLETFERPAAPADDESWLLTGTFFDRDEVRAAPFEALGFPLELLWPFDRLDDLTTDR